MNINYPYYLLLINKKRLTKVTILAMISEIGGNSSMGGGSSNGSIKLPFCKTKSNNHI